VDERWGYIDKAGRIVISPQFDYAESFFGGLARVRLSNSRTGMIDRTGRIVWSTPE
jgi:serine/threonine-protein kinase